MFPLKINWFLSASFSYWKSIIFHWSKSFHAFALADQRHFSIDFAIYLKLLFCIENKWKFFYWKSIDLPASKTSGFPFIFYTGIFKYIFLLILPYFWNCHFILKTITIFSIENRRVFANIVFLLKINTKFSIDLPTYIFSTCDFVLKTNTIFNIENQLIFPASFFYLGIFNNFFLLVTSFCARRALLAGLYFILTKLHFSYKYVYLLSTFSSTSR